MSISQALVFSLALTTHEIPATTPEPWQPMELAQVYTDLPGVKSQEEAEEQQRIFCEQSIVKIQGYPTRGPEYETVNNCRKGDGPVFQSPRTPLSLERQKRGLDY